MKRTAEEIEDILTAEAYSSKEEAFAACQALSEPGDEIHVHAADCEIEGGDESTCTCEPTVIVHRGELAQG